MEALMNQLFLLSGILAGVQETFTCRAGSFLAGETASITCNFSKDVSKEHYNYYVGWYSHDSVDNMDENEAMACFRTLSDDLVCNPARGFRFNNIINELLVLEIPNVTEHFAGRYSCQYVPQDGKSIETCSLNVTGVAKTRIPPIPRDTLATQTPSNTEPSNHPFKEPGTGLTPINIVLIVAVGLICIAMSTYICWQIRKHKCERRRKSKEPRREQEIREISTEEDYAEWLKKLPTPAREALADEGFDQLIALKNATDDDISSLKLRKGHMYLVEDARRRLQDSSKSSRWTSLASTDSRKAPFNINTQTTPTDVSVHIQTSLLTEGSASFNSPTPPSDENV